MKPYALVGIRNRTLLESYGILDSYRHKITGTDCQIEKALEVGEGFSAHLCYEIADRKRLRHLMEKEIRAGKYTKEFFHAIDTTYKDVVKNIKSTARDDYSKLSPEQLIEDFDTFYQIYITTLHPMVLAIYASDLQDFFEEQLKAAIGGKKLSQEKVIELTALLLTPSRLTTVQKEEQILFTLQKDFEKQYQGWTKENYATFCQTAAVRKTFQQLVDSYGWFHMEYLGEPRTVDDYRKQVWDRIEEHKKSGSDWKEATSPAERLQTVVEEQKKFFRDHPDAKLLQKLVFAMQEFLIVLDFSKADLVEGIFHSRKLLMAIAHRVGLNSWIDVRYLLPDELKDLLKTGQRVSTDYIRDRKSHFTCVLEDSTITPHFGGEAVQVAEKLLEKEEIRDVKELKGLTAYPGKVVGEACIVTGASERDKFKRGQILVTRDTTTELTSVIAHSLAIVADQGSLLSHTAIVAREFKIPCLVLTKIGTKVIADGDILEVDASHGIVRILEKAQ